MFSNIHKLYLAHFLITLHFFGAVLVPFFTDFGGLNFSQIMILQAWFMFWTFILEVPTGTIADFFGRKISIAASGIVGAIAAIVYVSAPNFYVFLLAEFLWALGAALLSGADTALIYDTLKQEKREKESKKILSRYESFGLAGILVAAPIGSVLAANFGVVAPMAATAIPFLLAALMILTVPEPKIFRIVKKENYGKILREGFLFFAKHKILKLFALDVAVVGMAGYLMIWLFQPLLKEAGVPIFWYGFVQAAFVLGEIFVLNKIHAIENLFGGKKKFLFGSAVLIGAGFLLAAATKFVPAVLLSIMLVCSLALTRNPIISSYANKYIPTAKRATVLSAMSMARRITVAVSQLAVGFIVDAFSLNAALLALGGLIIAFAFFSKIEEKMLKD